MNTTNYTDVLILPIAQESLGYRLMIKNKLNRIVLEYPNGSTKTIYHPHAS